jgi:multimeric flavodoxin WrbA
MNSKVCAIFTSPRQDSNSSALAESVCRGAESTGLHVDRFDFSGHIVQPCKACDYCRTVDFGKAMAGSLRFCAQHDDMDSLYPLVVAADVLILASPVYSFSVSAQLKLVIDRLYALWREGARDGLAGKTVVPVLTFGDVDVFASGGVNALRMIQDLARFYRMNRVLPLYAQANSPNELAHEDALLERGFALGATLHAPA